MGVPGTTLAVLSGALVCGAIGCSEARPFENEGDAGLFSEACRACHGSSLSPAPPRDLAGSFDTSSIGVGAHRAHLTAAHSLSAPVACGDCHRVPTQLHSPGHLDDPPPAEVIFSGLSVADTASAAWDRSAATCSGTYCHGGGRSLSADTAPGLNRVPVWTAGSSQIYCGSCHGAPPKDATHALNIDLGDCFRCHAGTIDRAGNILLSGPPDARASLHINGVVDVQSP